jgi:hypothetical protein
MEWHKLWPQEEGGTNLFWMYAFIERIIDQLAIHWPGCSFCFTMDNLNIHHNPVLLQKIASRGHRYFFRSTYCSVDGLMECVFHMIHIFLLQYFRTINYLPVLGNRTDLVIAQMTNFKNYFFHV